MTVEQTNVGVSAYASAAADHKNIPPLNQAGNKSFNNPKDVLQQLIQGSLPQQQPAAAESSLRKKFSTLQSGVQLQQQQLH